MFSFMNDHFSRLLKGISILFFIGLTVLLFPIKYRLLGYHIDVSHSLAANLFMYKNIFFGRDMIFSYGPLGFLMTPLDIGINMTVAKLLHLLLWTVFFSIIFHFSLNKNISVSQLGLFFGFFYLSRILCPSLDYFIALLVIINLCLYLCYRENNVYFLISFFLTILSIFIKFSSSFICISSTLSFLLILFFLNKRNRKTGPIG